MKKFFTACALASLSLCASAQLITVTVDGKPVANGDVVESSTLEIGEDGGIIFMWELKPHTIIKANEDVDLDVYVTNPEGKGSVKYVGKEAEETNISFCGVNAVGGMAGQCLTLKPGDTRNMMQSLDAGVEGELQCYFMSGDYVNPDPEKLDVYAQVKIDADGSTAAETFEFTLHMVYSSPDNAVNTILGASDFSVVGGSIVADGEVEVYDLAGRRVVNEDLNGMYIVRSDGRAAKVVVK